jgi:hypothetical protein
MWHRVLFVILGIYPFDTHTHAHTVHRTKNVWYYTQFCYLDADFVQNACKVRTKKRKKNNMLTFLVKYEMKNYLFFFVAHKFSIFYFPRRKPYKDKCYFSRNKFQISISIGLCENYRFRIVNFSWRKLC